MSLLHAPLDWLFYARARLAFARGTATQPALEIVYKDLFARDLAALGLADEFHATGSAANYGLLYLLLRIVSALRPKVIVELGAGQSTILIDRLAAIQTPVPAITTVEHDAYWASLIQAQVKHALNIVPLRHLSAAGRTIEGYDLSGVNVSAINLLLVDGPVAKGWKTRFNRWGALPLLERLAEDFVVIVDDAERPGDRDHGRSIIRKLEASGRKVHVGHITAANRQMVIAGGSFAAAAYY